MLLFFVVATVLVSNAIVVESKCSDDYTYVEAINACLKVHSETASYADARSACQSENGDLVKVLSDDIAHYVYELAGAGHIWMGVNDIKQEGHFENADGSALSSYQPWNSGEPNDYHSNEDCAHLIDTNQARGMWNDIDCNFKMKFVCEEPIESPCSDGYTYVQPVDACLKVHSEGTSYANARSVCQSENGDLVKILDVKKAHYVYELAGDGHIWLGINDIKQEGHFENADGSPLSSYQPWNSGEPNDYHSNEDCAHLIDTRQARGMWNDIDCNFKMKFVCEESLESPCSNGYTYVKPVDACLKVHSEGTSYANARSVCQSENGDLVKILDVKKAHYVYELAGDGHIWLGINDIKQEGHFENADGSPLSSYQPWNSGEPNDYHSNEDCAHLIDTRQARGMWNDIDCNFKMKFVCEESKMCPDGYTYYEEDDSCVKGFDTPATFDDARRTCQQDNGDLVKVNDGAKSDFVYDLVGVDGHIYIQVEDRRQEGHFEHSDGTPLSSYTPWNAGEPNNYNGNEDCGHLISKEHTKMKGLWNDIDCNSKFLFACEIDLSPPEELGCDDDWVHNEDADVCIKVVNDKKADFDGARAHCQNEGGDLVTMVKNRKQKNFVKSLLTKRTFYWIGIFDKDQDSSFEYIDGKSLGRFKAFRRGEPNNKNGKEHCVEMKNGKWFDKRCSRRRNFVCQKDLH